MATWSSRRKIRHQCASAVEDLEKAQKHLTYIQALATERSEYINECLPGMIVSVEMLIEATKQFDQGL